MCILTLCADPAGPLCAIHPGKVPHTLNLGGSDGQFQPIAVSEPWRARPQSFVCTASSMKHAASPQAPQCLALLLQILDPAKDKHNSQLCYTITHLQPFKVNNADVVAIFIDYVLMMCAWAEIRNSR